TDEGVALGCYMRGSYSTSGRSDLRGRQLLISPTCVIDQEWSQVRLQFKVQILPCFPSLERKAILAGKYSQFVTDDTNARGRGALCSPLQRDVSSPVDFNPLTGDGVLVKPYESAHCCWRNVGQSISHLDFTDALGGFCPMLSHRFHDVDAWFESYNPLQHAASNVVGDLDWSGSIPEDDDKSSEWLRRSENEIIAAEGAA
ncbi:uncharacterized protein PV07_12802, partial [Cladophialophora immunda]